MNDRLDSPCDDPHLIGYSHSAYLIAHPVDGFVKVGVAHVLSAEIRHYVMAGGQVVQLLFMNRGDAHELQSTVLRSVARHYRSMDQTHPILGEAGLNGHRTSWQASGGTYDLGSMAVSMNLPHVNALNELRYEVLRTTLGLPRLLWQDWRIGPPPRDYYEPLFPANHISRTINTAAQT
jgi:hypothetical protein